MAVCSSFVLHLRCYYSIHAVAHRMTCRLVYTLRPRERAHHIYQTVAMVTVWVAMASPAVIVLGGFWQTATKTGFVVGGQTSPQTNNKYLYRLYGVLCAVKAYV